MSTLLIVSLVAVGACLATLLGGFFALKFKDKLHLMLGLSAGLMIAVAFFDLIPEAIELAEHADDLVNVMLWVALGFVSFMLVDRFGGHYHSHGDDNCAHDGHDSHNNENTNGMVTGAAHQGKVGATSLSLHSFLDGLVIGVAFQISAELGAVVALAVLAHGFSDGVSTVTLITRHGGDKKSALRWLALDASAPVVGIIIGSLVGVPFSFLSPLLGMFAGFFLYIGASDLLPESHHAHKTVWTTVATLVGMGIILTMVLVGHGH